MGGRGGGGSGGARGSRGGSSESWRNSDPKYQEKTLGGVYFYSAPTGWGNDIDKATYNKLPKYAQESVIMLDASKTMDGTHYSMYFAGKDGTMHYIDDYGLSDFKFQVSRARSQMAPADGRTADRVGDKLKKGK